MYTVFSEHLKQIRQATKSTQKQLADYINVSVQSVSKWEKGTSLPSIEYLPKIAEFFNCSVNAFFSDFELQVCKPFIQHSDDSDGQNVFAAILSYDGILKGYLKKPEEEREPSLTIPVNAMFLPAVYDCLQKYDYVSPSTLQDNLDTDYFVSCKIFDALVKMGIIDNSDPNDRFRVVKHNIDLLIPYIKMNTDEPIPKNSII